MTEPVNWALGWAAITAWAMCVYVILVAGTLVGVYFQLRELKKHRTLQASLAIFKELHTREARRARRDIYERVPGNIERTDENDLKMYSEMADEALITFELIGYLIGERYIDPAPLIDTHWLAIWKCWKKCERLIGWAREQRNEPTHFRRFEELFDRCEAHRRENQYEEPRFASPRR